MRNVLQTFKRHLICKPLLSILQLRDFSFRCIFHGAILAWWGGGQSELCHWTPAGVSTFWSATHFLSFSSPRNFYPYPPPLRLQEHKNVVPNVAMLWIRTCGIFSANVSSFFVYSWVPVHLLFYFLLLWCLVSFVHFLPHLPSFSESCNYWLLCSVTSVGEAKIW